MKEPLQNFQKLLEENERWKDRKTERQRDKCDIVYFAFNISLRMVCKLLSSLILRRILSIPVSWLIMLCFVQSQFLFLSTVGIYIVPHIPLILRYKLL